MKEFMTNLLDKENPLCVKAFLGILAGVALIVNMFVYPSEAAIYSVSVFAFGALAISGAETIKK